MLSLRKIVFFVLVLFVTGCSSNGKKAQAEEILFNPQILGEQLELSVRSNGCTQAADFYLVVTADEIELRRIKPDLCRAAPQLVRLSFSYDFSADVYQFKNQVRFSSRYTQR